MTNMTTNIPTFTDKDYIGINGVGIRQLTHPHFEEWFRYIITVYDPPKPPRICLFVPCTAIKPYYNSPIHGVINKAIYKYEDYIHKIVISNAGIIPYEFADQYPFNSYDWNPQFETEEIKNKYIELTTNRLISFFNKHSTKYLTFISYLRPDAEELIALKIASQITKINIINIDVNIRDCDNILPDTSDRDLVLTLEHNLDKLRQTIENINQPPNISNRGKNMPRKIHYQTEIKLDIQSDMTKEAQSLISTTLEKVWPDTYFAELDPQDYIDIVVDLWIRYYIDSASTKEAISKIKSANPPPNIIIYLVFNLFDDEDSLLIDYSEIRTEPLFRAYLTTKDLWDTYAYNIQAHKFESLEITEPAYIEEIKQGMTEKEKMDFDELILQSYGFHNRLLEITTKKILLYTAQPPDKIDQWNKKGIIPKGTYLTDKMQRAEYYWEEGDIIVDYRIKEDKIIQTSEFGGAKEYVAIEDIQIR